MFHNRNEAGVLLASRLRKYKDQSIVLMAIPRGGVPVASEVARELNVPLEVFLVKKLGHPQNKEYAIGAVGLTDSFIVPHDDVSDGYIDQGVLDIRCRLQEMNHKFMGERKPQPLKGKTVVIVDDGIATGNTLQAALRILKKQQPVKIVVAAPVISKRAAQQLETQVDEVASVLIPEQFAAVGNFYEDFRQVTDEEVVSCLQKWNIVHDPY